MINPSDYKCNTQVAEIYFLSGFKSKNDSAIAYYFISIYILLDAKQNRLKGFIYLFLYTEICSSNGCLRGHSVLA